MLLVALGFLIGGFGTLIGVGGGVILVPILLQLYPNAAPAWIGSISMGMVALNATSGSVSYYFKKTIHLRAALIFAMASLPGSFVGVWAVNFVDRSFFEMAFGFAMMFFAVVLFLRGGRKKENGVAHHTTLDMNFYVKGSIISFLVGFVASFLGIGGGIIHVPLLSEVLNFPVHLATGTSHLILAITAWFATALHLLNGDVQILDPVLWQVALGAAAGAQVGARLSSRVSGRAIIRILALVLFAVGFGLLFGASARQIGH